MIYLPSISPHRSCLIACRGFPSLYRGDGSNDRHEPKPPRSMQATKPLCFCPWTGSTHLRETFPSYLFNRGVSQTVAYFTLHLTRNKRQRGGRSPWVVTSARLVCALGISSLVSSTRHALRVLHARMADTPTYGQVVGIVRAPAMPLVRFFYIHS